MHHMKVVHILARTNKGGTSEWLKNLTEGLIFSGHTNYIFRGSTESNELEENPTNEKEEIPKGYDSLAELNYYGDNKDFMRFHKRTK